MPRKARVVIPGMPYHLTQRGNNKQQVFFDEDDYKKYLYLCEEYLQENGMKILAYCLMPNHVHIISVAINEHSFAHALRIIHACYAQFFNKKYLRIGHLWQSRYYSCLLDQQHLFSAIRYVERNPVRAKLSFKAYEWKWSSCREHIYGNKGIITLQDSKKHINIESWKNYIDQSESDLFLSEIRKETLAGRCLGSEEFKLSLNKDLKINMFPIKTGRPKKIE